MGFEGFLKFIKLRVGLSIEGIKWVGWCCSTHCSSYSRYDQTAPALALVCVLVSSCQERNCSCSGCHTAPVPCRQQIRAQRSESGDMLVYSILLHSSGLIISGGSNVGVNNSVELYDLVTGEQCELPPLPGELRYDHIMEEMMVCGGGHSPHSKTSCLALSDGVWQPAASLLVQRIWHSSWPSPSGLILLGGSDFLGDEESPRTSEIIGEACTTSFTFQLEYDTVYVEVGSEAVTQIVIVNSEACAIRLTASVILTGGLYSLTRVSEYSESGYLRDLPPLLHGRDMHGCSYFSNEEGTKVTTCITVSDKVWSCYILILRPS